MRICSFLCSLVILFFVTTDSSNADFIKDKIAVLDFDIHGEDIIDGVDGSIISQWLITSLVKQGRCDIVERQFVRKIIEEQKLSSTGLVDEKTSSRLGKMLGAKIIISGTVMEFNNSIEINTRIVNAETASIMSAENIRAEDAEDLRVLINQMVEKIIKVFPLEGYVLKRSGSIISIDLGRRDGIKPGMHFVVFKEGDTIRHPKTGQIMEIEIIETGIVVIEVIKEEISEARVISEFPQNAVRYGNRIKGLYDTVSAGQLIKFNLIEPYSEKPSKSVFFKGPSSIGTWGYSVSKIRSDMYAGLSMYFDPVSLKNKNVFMKIESKTGTPVDITFLSHVKGFSREDDEDTYVPVSFYVPLSKGVQEIHLDPAAESVPGWWYEENSRNEDIIFNIDDLRILDFAAVIEKETGPVSDEIIIHSILFKP